MGGDRLKVLQAEAIRVRERSFRASFSIRAVETLVGET